MLWRRRQPRLPVAASNRRRFLVVLVACVAAAASLSSADAEWVGNSGFLWNMSAPFSLSVESHADAAWTQRLAQSAADWSNSGVVSVDLAAKGKIALYDGYYGDGEPCAWTQYWQHGGHISHDAVYLNESCLAGWSDYWKQYAVCQELGHALGLPDHDTTPTVPSCTAPSLPATAPGADDFAELALLYGATTTSSGKGGKGSGGLGSTSLSGGMTATGDGAGATTAGRGRGGVATAAAGHANDGRH